MSEKWSLWKRNVVDKYKNWPTDAIRRDLQETANPFSVCMEHWQGDFNISTLIRNANAFNAEKVFYLGKKRFDRRGTVAVDNNISNTHKLGEFDWLSLEKPPLMLFGEEGVGLTAAALKIADYSIEIPQYGSVRSLNVGTSSGILMYDFVRSLESSKVAHRWQIKTHGENENAPNEPCQLTLL